MSPRWRMRAMMAEAAAVLPASMQVPASATTGTPRTSSRSVVIQGLVSRPGGHADALAEIGKVNTVPKTLQSNGLPLSGVAESQMPRTRRYSAFESHRRV